MLDGSSSAPLNESQQGSHRPGLDLRFGMRNIHSRAHVAALVLSGLFLSGCDNVPWHRFIVPDPYPNLLHIQYSNGACDAFPTANGEVIVEYDAQGCACTPAELSGPKWNPATAFWQRSSAGDLNPLPNMQLEWGHSWIIETGGEKIAVSTHHVTMPDRRKPPDLYLFLDQCAHLPGVGDLRTNEGVMAYALRQLQEFEANATASWIEE